MAGYWKLLWSWCECINWRENQFDIILKSGKEIGDPVEIR